MITKTDRWDLEISDWQHALDEGKQPYEATGFGHVWDNIPEGYCGYRTTVFSFDRPPSRDDFLEVCRSLPWTHGWEDSLLPTIEANAWPMVAGGYKAAHVDLLNADGVVCGRLTVHRHTTYRNSSYPGLPVGFDARQEVLSKLRGDNRAKASEHLDANMLRVWEAFSKLDDPSHAALVGLIRAELRSAGFIKGKSKQKAATA